MNKQHLDIAIKRTNYDRNSCEVGVVHLGYGAFHRAHQAVYIDDYMDATGDLKWGIAAVNLREEDADEFKKHVSKEHGYLLKTISPNGERFLREVRPHIRFEDWSEDAETAENLLGLESVHVVSMTVTESGYYLNDDWTLNTEHPVIVAEANEGSKRSVYSYLAAGLKQRMEKIGAPITILCCDNIRSNGIKLERNFLHYLQVTGQPELADWVQQNATFPNSMVDRITPNATPVLQEEISLISPALAENAIHGEHFSQWVIEKDFAGEFPSLNQVGVDLVEDVDPFEEAKIRILNGGHTALCYLGALAGHQTFDQAMADEQLRRHFNDFEMQNVLPGLMLELPFDKQAYFRQIEARFCNSAIADDLGRICKDGWSKFSIFIRPTIKGCLKQGISPKFGYDSIASWYVYARRFANNQMHIPYEDPYWDQLKPYLKHGREADFAGLSALWSNLPEKYDEFVPELVSAIEEMEEKWPI